MGVFRRGSEALVRYRLFNHGAVSDAVVSVTVTVSSLSLNRPELPVFTVCRIAIKLNQLMCFLFFFWRMLREIRLSLNPSVHRQDRLALKRGGGLAGGCKP